MATGIGNPAGLVQILDGGVPRTITGVARATLSGGVFAFVSGAADLVSSGTNSFVTADLPFAGNASGLWVNGVVLQTAASGAPVTIVTRGTIIALACGTVTAGAPQVVTGVNGVTDVTTGSVANTEYAVGRALTSATSGGYAIVSLNL